MKAPPDRPSVIRSLGFAASASIIVCNVIGQGIFLKTRVMTCELGSAQYVLGVWILAGLLSLCGALSLGELGAMMPRSGGVYVFLRRAYGPLPAFAFGWMNFWVTGPASVAALASGAAIFFNMLSNRFLEQFTTTFSIVGQHLTISGLQWGALLFILLTTAVNLAPVGVNGRIATTLTVAKLSTIATLAIAAFFLAHGSWTHYTSNVVGATCIGVDAAVRHGFPALAAAFIAALYAYQGWSIITSLGGEIKNPGRVIPLALWGSTVIVIICYLLANSAYFFAMTPREIASLSPTTSVAVELIGRIFGSTGLTIAAAILFLSTIAALHTSILTEARTTYALTRDGVLFPALGIVTSNSHVPARAVLANGLVAAVLAILGSFETLTNYFIFNVWLFNVATIGAVFVLRRREPDAQRPYHTWGYPVVPALFIAVATWLVVQTLVSAPLNSSVGLLIIAIGLLFYLYRAVRTARSSAPTTAESTLPGLRR